MLLTLDLRKSQSRQEAKRNDSISVIVHDFTVVGPVPASNLSLAKGLAAERARQILDDPNGNYHLAKLCDCGEQMVVDNVETPTFEMPPEMLNDETEEGFAALARIVTEEIHEAIPETRSQEAHDEDQNDDDRKEVDEGDYVEGEVFSMPF